MRLIIINGSPRGEKSNSKHIINRFIAGFSSVIGTDVPVFTLTKPKEMAAAKVAIANCDVCLFVFPLYVHAMPGIVMSFFASLQGMQMQGKRLGFIVQSGFLEAHQSRWLEQYLETLPEQVGATYLGTVIKGGMEGVQLRPVAGIIKMLRPFEALGEAFARENAFSLKRIRSIAKPEKLGAGMQVTFRVLRLTGLTNFYWNMKLKENNAFEKRNARPFA